jgi:hypothetical protein
MVLRASLWPYFGQTALVSAIMESKFSVLYFVNCRRYAYCDISELDQLSGLTRLCYEA